MRLSLLTILAVLLTGCSASRQPTGLKDTSVKLEIEGWHDGLPRYSHEGNWITFMRIGADGESQLMLADPTLAHVHPLFHAEVSDPTLVMGYLMPQGVAEDRPEWSPHDHRIAFERIENFNIDGEELSGTAIWSYSLSDGHILPLALHPKKYKNVFYYYSSPKWSSTGDYLALTGRDLTGQNCIIIRPTHAVSPALVHPLFDRYGESDSMSWHTFKGSTSLAYSMVVVGAPHLADIAKLYILKPGDPNSEGCGCVWQITASQIRNDLHIPRNDSPAPRISSIKWSPNGNLIAFTLSYNSSSSEDSSLWIYSLSSHKAFRCTPLDGYGYMNAVWKGNSRLCGVSVKNGAFHAVSVNVYRHTAQNLASIPSPDCSWSPKRSWIVAATKKGGISYGETTLVRIATGLR